LMIVTTSDVASSLNRRAQADRVSRGDVLPHGVELADGSTAGVGDWITTRRNDRRLTTLGGRDFVKNGDGWVVCEVTSRGLTVRRVGGGARVRLPHAYAVGHVELGYCATVHCAQGMTVDRVRALIDTSCTRESL